MRRSIYHCLVGAQLLAVLPAVALAQELTEAQAASGLYQANQAWLRRTVTLSTAPGRHDSLAEYAAKCDEASGIRVPSFSCGDGTEVPGQGGIPNATHCDHPNVLNERCDPGSRFQVLPGASADAVAVAHCRKVGLPVAGDVYNDIAVIQYNKKNGALCFYQALTNLPGQHIPAPREGDARLPASATMVDVRGIAGAAWSDGQPHWYTPEHTEGVGCTGCHDNGGFIRSEYLAQLTTPPNVLPNAASGFDNHDTPVRYVGLDFAANRSWSIEALPAAGDTGLPCTTCHRLGISNHRGFIPRDGTAAHFANFATAAAQPSKNPHSPTSPIWMRLGQIYYKPEAEASATRFRDCAVGFADSGFTTPPPGCTATSLGLPWDATSTQPAVDMVPIISYVLKQAWNQP